MRQYYPIWHQIKTHGTATIVAQASKHRRIIQAVRKEKHKDAGFRLLQSEKNICWKLRHKASISKGTIEFHLEEVSSSRILLSDL